MKYYLIAGEASGDLHASRLMRALREQDAEAEFRYFGGDAMQAEGGTLVRHYRTLAYMGFYQVARHLPEILRGRSQCKQDIAAWRPDAIVLVDYPGFNLHIAQWARSALPAVRIVYYISPKIWAWKSWRLRSIRRDVDLLLSILPFEVEWYRRRGYEVTYVGNPTVDELEPVVAEPFDRAAFCHRNELNDNQSIIALVAGSRRAEVEDNLPLMIEACCGLPGYQLVVAGAPGLDEAFYAPILDRHRVVPPVKVVFGQTYDLLRASDIATVTSGTATLETAYLGVPQVVCYYFRGGRLVYRIMKAALRSIRYVSLVNLLLGREAVRELLGPYLTIPNLRSEVTKFTDNSPERRRVLADYDEMRRLLGSAGAPRRAAAAVTALLRRSGTPPAS